MNRAACFSFLALAATFACSPEFPPQSTLSSLRVLGVRKDKPYARPGATVKLAVLYDDAVAADTDAAPRTRDINILWIAKCENPIGDTYYGCFEQLAKAFARIGSGDSGSFEGLDYGHNHVEFSFTLSPTIVKDHAPPVDRSPRYGLAYVFFVLCAGDVRPAPAGQQFPLGCYSKSGEQLGADDFIVGYTGVYAYENITNTNPTVKGFSVDGKTITPECIDEACIAEELGGEGPSVLDAGLVDAAEAGSDAGAQETGAPTSGPVDPCADPNGPACFEVCTDADQKDCPEHEVKLESEPATLEIDEAARVREGGELREQAWINYYTDQGRFTNDVKLLGDATQGYREDHGTKLRVPKKVGTFHVWAVAHDNRGGVGWVKVRLGTRAK